MLMYQLLYQKLCPNDLVMSFVWLSEIAWYHSGFLVFHRILSAISPRVLHWNYHYFSFEICRRFLPRVPEFLPRFLQCSFRYLFLTGFLPGFLQEFSTESSLEYPFEVLPKVFSIRFQSSFWIPSGISLLCFFWDGLTTISGISRGGCQIST